MEAEIAMTNKKVRIALIAIDLLVAITTIYGALFVVPTLPASWLVFFPNYTLPALGLGAVGLVSLLAALGVIWRPKPGAELSVLAGVMMAVFEVVEALTAGNLITPPPGTSGGGPLWLQPFYFAVGSVMVILGARLWVRTAPGEKWSSRLRQASSSGSGTGAR
jgi:hypothetical protein